MRKLPYNKLLEISNFANESVILANFLASSNLDLHISKLSTLSPQADAISVLEALNKDIDSTVKRIEKALVYLSLVDENHYLPKVKNGNKVDLRILFGENYNTEDRSITFNNFSIYLDNPYDKKDLKNLIVSAVTGLTADEYKNSKKILKKFLAINDSELSSDFDKIQYLAILKNPNTEKYMAAIKKARELTNEYGKLRLAYGSESKVILNDITFERAMIDSVANTSTYFSKVAGYEQVSRKHKHKKEILEKIKAAIDNSKFISAIEIDQDADLESVLNSLEQLKTVNANFSKEGFEFIFKARKLGNYNANGLYCTNNNIVAIDINSPSSFIHELSHAIYYNNQAIYNSPATKLMVAEMKKQMRLDEYNKIEEVVAAKVDTSAKQKYYSLESEIFARMGEIGFILNKYNYTDEEGFKAFVERVKEEQKNEKNDADGSNDVVSINLSHPIEKYIGNKIVDNWVMDNETNHLTKSAYFNLSEMTPTMLLNIKKYSQCMFGVEGQEPTNINEFYYTKEITKVVKKERAESTHYEPTSVSLINSPETALAALDYNEDEKIVDTRTFLRHILTQMTHLNRTTKILKDELPNEQRKIVESVVNWVREKNNPHYNKELLNIWVDIGYWVTQQHEYRRNALESVQIIDSEKAKGLREGINYAQPIVMNDFITPVNSELERLLEKESSIHAKMRCFNVAEKRSNAYYKLSDEAKEARYSFNDILRKAKNDFYEIRDNNLPESHLHSKSNGKIWFHSIQNKTRYQFTEAGKASYCKWINSYNLENLHNNYEDVLKTLNIEDNFLYAISSDDALRSKIDENTLSKIDDYLTSIIISCGLADEIFDSKNTFRFDPNNAHIKKINQAYSKFDLLACFPYRKMGYENVLDFKIAVNKGEVCIGDVAKLVPETYNDWLEAQLQSKEMYESTNNPYEIKNNDIENIEKENDNSVDNTFNTESFLDNFLSEFVHDKPTENVNDKPTENTDINVVSVKDKKSQPPQVKQLNQLSLF